MKKSSRIQLIISHKSCQGKESEKYRFHLTRKFEMNVKIQMHHRRKKKTFLLYIFFLTFCETFFDKLCSESISSNIEDDN